VGGREEIGSSTATRTREGRGEERGERERKRSGQRASLQRGRGYGCARLRERSLRFGMYNHRNNKLAADAAHF
jgi:hypothetical protein